MTRTRSQTRVNRSCVLQDHSFRHTAACPYLCPGWSHWVFCLVRAGCQGWTPGSCLALYFASTPSINKRCTQASPFSLLSGTFPRGSICVAWLSWCGGRLANDNILRTAPGGAGCVAGRTVAFGTRGSGVHRMALLDNSNRDRTDRPLSLLACCTRYSQGVTQGLSW